MQHISVQYTDLKNTKKSTFMITKVLFRILFDSYCLVTATQINGNPVHETNDRT